MRRNYLGVLVSISALTFFAGCGSGGKTPTAQAAPAQAPAPFAQPPILAGTPDIATLVAKVRPGVVTITATQESPAHRRPKLPFGHPFGSDDDDDAPRRGLGSGFIIDAQGHVVTNAHVVADADRVRVKLPDDREFEAKVVGRDRRLDVAVLELQGAKDLPATALGSSGDLRVGEYVVAIGNPFGLGSTVTMGIVSAKGRAIGAGPYDDFIQTDASINPGNSGGPLFNLRGQVVGINTAINPRGQGIGFAIPVDVLRDVLPQLLSSGTVSRGRLGLTFQPVDAALARALGLDKPKGAIVGDVQPGGAADKAGIKSGDLVLAVGNQEVLHAQDLPRLVARNAPGTKVTLKLQRDRVQRDVPVTLDELKEEGAEGPRRPAQSAPAVPQKFGIELSDAEGGALVERVLPGSKAEDSLRRGDVIIEVQRQPVRNAAEVAKLLDAATSPVMLRIRRGETTRYVALER